MNLDAYNAALNRSAVLLRDDRGLLEITGADRAKWLNNLVTNVVLTLQPGEGNYAFVINVKGRTQFDLNYLIRPDSILLDIDRRLVEQARKFLDRYIITEAVEIHDRTATSQRIAIVGPKAHTIADTLGFPNLTPMAWLQHVDGRIGESTAQMFRHDSVGLPGAEFILFGDKAESDARHALTLAHSSGAAAIDAGTLDALRIEAGIPKSVDDIDEEVIPPETGQIERGINYRKGCYLGQEVIERMRAHKVLARRLVGIRVEGETPLPRLTVLELAPAQAQDSAEPGDKAEAGDEAKSGATAHVGRAMSGCLSPALDGAPLSLAYLKTAHAKPGVALIARTPDGPRKAEVTPLPVRRN